MRRGRTLEERLVDRLLLLYLIDQTNKIGYVGGKTRAQKLVFLSETDQQRKKLKGFNYGYVRLDYGPYSNDLNDDIALLKKEGFLCLREKSHYLTLPSNRILDLSKECLDRNTKILAPIDKIVQKWARKKTEELLKSVYRRKALYHPQKTIKALRKPTILLKRQSEEEVAQTFRLTESEVATLEILFDPEAVESLERAQESARTKPMKSWSDLLASG